MGWPLQQGSETGFSNNCGEVERRSETGFSHTRGVDKAGSETGFSNDHAVDKMWSETGFSYDHVFDKMESDTGFSTRCFDACSTTPFTSGWGRCVWCLSRCSHLGPRPILNKTTLCTECADHFAQHVIKHVFHVSSNLMSDTVHAHDTCHVRLWPLYTILSLESTS